MSIKNEAFWKRWEDGSYDEALACAIEEPENQADNNRLQTMLFGDSNQLRQTGAVVSMSVGEFMYDYMMINPTVVQGLDFARKEDLSILFNLNQFSSGIDLETTTGNIAQLQGYVAEQMMAIELQSKGHDVDFPETSNHPGWDFKVDGHPFQVKCLASPQGVNEHFDKYPEIPVFVNKELSDHFRDNPNVYVSSIEHAEVLEATKSTLAHSEDLLDFEIPLLALSVSSFVNIRRIYKDDFIIHQAVFNVVNETSSRIVLAFAGKKTGIIVGTMLFGPAGGVTGAFVGTYMGTAQAGVLSKKVKRIYARKQEQEVVQSVLKLLDKVNEKVDEKIAIKKKKFNLLLQNLDNTEANNAIKKEVQKKYIDENQYLVNKKEEIHTISKRLREKSIYIIDHLSSTMATIVKTRVHPVHFQKELLIFQRELKQYNQKI